MMVFKNNAGFTLIEVILAIAIVALGMMPILILQNEVLTRVNRVGNRLQRIFFAQQFMAEAREKREPGTREFYLERQEEFPATKLLYRVEPADVEPQFEGLSGLYSERVIMTWKSGPRQEKLVLPTYGFEPVRERKKQ